MFDTQLTDRSSSIVETTSVEPINTELSQWTEDTEDECIPPQETVMEVKPHSESILMFTVFTEDSDIQDGEGCELHVQAETQKLEVKLNHSTRPIDRVKPFVVQPPEIFNLNPLFSNTPTALSNDIGEDLEKTVPLLWKNPQEAEEVTQELDLLSKYTVDEKPLLRYEELSYSIKSSGEAAGMVGKALEHPCEGVIVVECISEEHLGITSTDEVSIAEPRTILFEMIRMKEFRGWFYDEYDPGDTWIHC